MQTTSALYKSILAGDHRFEWKVVVNGSTTYGQDVIVRAIGGSECLPKIIRQTFGENTPSIGNCISSEFTVTLLLASSAIPRMATIEPYFRVVNDTQSSEWIHAGVYFIDTRKEDEASGTLALDCYDAMLKANGEEGKTYADLTSYDEWPISMSNALTEIASIMGVSVDSRTSIGSGDAFMIGYPNDYTMREILSFIAAANGGSFTMASDGKLLLVPLIGFNSTTIALGKNMNSLKVASALAAWSKVTIYYGDEEAYEAGSDTGRSIDGDDPWAEQGTANSVLSLISGSSYQPFSANSVLLDPAAEIGDKVSFTKGSTTLYAHIWSCVFVCNEYATATVEAPGEDEVDHEYPYVSSADRKMKRMVKLGQPYYGVTISKQYGIQIVGYDENNEEINRALLNSSVFTMDVKREDGWEQQFFFDPERRAYVFKGALGADSIYADMGDIAELTVDRLSTSKKVRLYNLQNTSDDNFVHVQDNYIRLTTGSVKYDPNNPTTPLTEQATNRWGDPLYWQAIPDHINASGYPEDADGRQIYATTDVPTLGEDETLDDYKVLVYQYTELVKSSYEFVLENGTYVPVLTMGAGDSNGRTKGRLHKSANSFDIEFTDSSGGEMGIHMNSAGYMDIEGLRRATELDFSLFEQGGFSEEVDGGISYYYNVSFDSSGDPVRIWDSAHSTDIIWW